MAGSTDTALEQLTYASIFGSLSYLVVGTCPDFQLSDTLLGLGFEEAGLCDNINLSRGDTWRVDIRDATNTSASKLSKWQDDRFDEDTDGYSLVFRFDLFARVSLTTGHFHTLVVTSPSDILDWMRFLSNSNIHRQSTTSDYINSFSTALVYRLFALSTSPPLYTLTRGRRVVFNSKPFDAFPV
ncbi:hypothetical protein CROQUDRAFT_86807 [Cronartium quercuum f. sp. fusiforme G11]|uniref:Uncharacterized protein n=1 Tax=Cronartium quercuum f. sp. fusiforme G11 TaxID=708437 RepID=A0A9P6TI30_9BASI|nr:hypothetical protein CROQUDRAFT_86807 [Cronartium quercuum f. sp. fusiforme G11]